MARVAFAAAPLLALTALALACAVAVSSCPGSETEVIRECTTRSECFVNGSSTLTLAIDATVSASCQWIIRMMDDMYVMDTDMPFYLTAAGGCTRFLQIESDGGGSHGAGSSACATYRLLTGYLFFRSGSSVVLQPTPSYIRRLNAKIHSLLTLTFEAGRALSLCKNAELEITQDSFVSTPFLAANTTPCVTTLKAGTGRALSVTLVDLWPNPAPSGCACYERLTAEPGAVICWNQPSDYPIVDRHFNVTLNGAGSDCTIVLFAQVTELQTTFVVTTETPQVSSAPGTDQFCNQNLTIVISVTAVGGVVFSVAVALGVYWKRLHSRSRKVKLHRHLLHRPEEQSANKTEDPSYSHLEVAAQSHRDYEQLTTPHCQQNERASAKAAPKRSSVQAGAPARRNHGRDCSIMTETKHRSPSVFNLKSGQARVGTSNYVNAHYLLRPTDPVNSSGPKDTVVDIELGIKRSVATAAAASSPATGTDRLVVNNYEEIGL